MEIINDGKSIPELHPADGKLLTNGWIIVDGMVYLKSGVDADCWYEIDSVDDAYDISDSEAISELVDIINEYK